MSGAGRRKSYRNASLGWKLADAGNRAERPLVLMRTHTTPEQQNCRKAWLLCAVYAGSNPVAPTKFDPFTENPFARTFAGSASILINPSRPGAPLFSVLPARTAPEWRPIGHNSYLRWLHVSAYRTLGK